MSVVSHMPQLAATSSDSDSVSDPSCHSTSGFISSIVRSWFLTPNE